jgi:hypothetical protein
LGTSPNAPVTQSVSAGRHIWSSVAYGNARERARQHVRGEREVWRQRFIAKQVISDGHPCRRRGRYTRVLLLRQLSAHGWPLTDRVPATQIPALRLRTALASRLCGRALADGMRSRAATEWLDLNVGVTFVCQSCSLGGAVDKMIGRPPSSRHLAKRRQPSELARAGPKSAKTTSKQFLHTGSATCSAPLAAAATWPHLVACCRVILPQ